MAQARRAVGVRLYDRSGGRLRGVGPHRHGVRPLAFRLANRPGGVADDHAGHAHLRPRGTRFLVRSGLDQAGRRGACGRQAYPADPSAAHDEGREAETARARRQGGRSRRADAREDPVCLGLPVPLPRPIPAQRPLQAGRGLADRRRPQGSQDGISRQGAGSGSGAADRQGAGQGERIETSLAGLWQVCRFDEQEVTDRAGPTKTLPDMAAAHWMSIPVPGNKFEVKPELRFCHRFVYRTRVDVPAALAGRSFFLRFPSLSLIASVHVNGQFCGWTKAPFAQWECDVTRAVRPGRGQRDLRRRQGFVLRLQREEVRQELPLVLQYTGGLDGHAELGQPEFSIFPSARTMQDKSGILAAPSLVVAGGVYAADVFVKPSVRKKQLGVELTLVNTSARDWYECKSGTKCVSAAACPQPRPFHGEVRGLKAGRASGLRRFRRGRSRSRRAANGDRAGRALGKPAAVVAR